MNFNPTTEMSEAMDDRIQCQYCGRKFNEKAGNRHIPHCEKKYKEQLMKQGPPKAGGNAAAARKRAPSYGMRR